MRHEFAQHTAQFTTQESTKTNFARDEERERQAQKEPDSQFNLSKIQHQSGHYLQRTAHFN